MIGIYCIRYLDRFYVGQSVMIARRLKHHARMLQLGLHVNKRLQNAWNKHSDEFQFEVIELCALEILTIREQYWADILDCFATGFNCGKFVDNASRGTKHSPETIRKMSEIKIGKRHSEETKLKMSKSKKGKKFSEEHCRNIAKAKTGISHSEEQRKNHSKRMMGNTYTKGRKHSEETKLKMSKSRIGKKQSAETIQKRKKTIAARKIAKNKNSKTR